MIPADMFVLQKIALFSQQVLNENRLTPCALPLCIDQNRTEISHRRVDLPINPVNQLTLRRGKIITIPVIARKQNMLNRRAFHVQDPIRNPHIMNQRPTGSIETPPFKASANFRLREFFALNHCKSDRKIRCACMCVVCCNSTQPSAAGQTIIPDCLVCHPGTFINVSGIPDLKADNIGCSKQQFRCQPRPVWMVYHDKVPMLPHKFYLLVP